MKTKFFCILKTLCCFEQFSTYPGNQLLPLIGSWIFLTGC